MDVNDIIERLKQRDSEAWTMMINRYSKKVYNFALNFAGNREDASDITQDIFIKVYNNIDKFKEEKNFNSWLLKLSKNYCIDFWRKNKNARRKVELDDTIRNEAVHGQQQTPEDSLIRKNDINYLRGKLLLLPPDLRTLIIMRDIQDHSYRDIAEHFNIPLGTTKSRINRARAKLAKIILNEGKLNEL
ncbi:MAG: RNA polymerase sigma factor [Candidatus Aminicenantes bacterium]|nr:RNA polymerase sigma factor [Candidatus Aminicenantes bacterium]